jgi:acyl-CoA synthetase (AMP-forming)/AMP-acid ligase II
MPDDTLVAVLTAHAAEHPDRVALTFVPDLARNPDGESLTYAALDADARRLAVRLRERLVVGDRALLMYPSGLEFAVALAGCLYAGVIAVPVPLVDRGEASRDRATRVVRDAAATTVLTESAAEAAVSAWREAAGLTSVALLVSDRDGGTDAGAWTPPAIEGDSFAILQYTSGSTSEPRGVILDHRCVLAQVAMSRRMMAVGPEHRFGGWLPMYHDLGLMSQFLQPLVLGASCVLTPPFEFLKRPLRWLHLIDRHRLEVSLAPNFAYDLCRRKVTDEQLSTLDLSGWAIAGIGAEAVQATTLAAFAQRFAPAGFRREAFTVGYGLAEATVYTSVGERTEAPAVRTIDADRLERDEFVPVAADATGRTRVSCGRPCEIDVRIVHPGTNESLPEGRVGEIWLRGPAVARGYWGANAATTRTFQAVTAAGEKGFLRTGDLGTLYDGELFVTGRLKETLLVRGRNLYPQDIEQAVSGWHKAFQEGIGAVFAVDGSGGEEVVVIQECRARPGDEAQCDSLVALIRDGLFQTFGLASGRVFLVRPGSVPRTTSGKVQRTLVRQLYRAGDLLSPHRG